MGTIYHGARRAASPGAAPGRTPKGADDAVLPRDSLAGARALPRRAHWCLNSFGDLGEKYGAVERERRALTGS